ncbi:hypothetical protein [Nevskia soli]|jgi:hypothetical protein|uniref:hypothetical protein n=1 Tax=Nevskia soli TaxID=418856 RepID=UPI0015D7594C|nr:hypothetical protein [Nevskia soli]
MLRTNLLIASALAISAVTAASAAPPTIMVNGVGSSALFNTASYGAWKNLAGANALHYTISGSAPAGSEYPNFAQINDVRPGGGPVQSGTLSVVWNAAVTKVWVYLNVDSVVGNRSFFSVPRAQLQVDPSTETTPGANKIPSGLWGDDAAGLPAAIQEAINNAPFTAAYTDIRPEDAKYAEYRATSPYVASNLNGLGYGTGGDTPVGTPILSSYSSSNATPIDFNIIGNDPITGEPVPAFVTLSVGADPIVFIINKENASGLGAPGLPTNTTITDVRNVFEGTTGTIGSLFGITNTTPLNSVQREPISGTMNTTEFCVFRTHTIQACPTCSQEKGIDPGVTPNSNPLDILTSGGGVRTRAIGTSQLVGAVQNPETTTSTLANQVKSTDMIGYTFFGYGNVASIAGSANYGYLELDGIDPIFSAYSNGELPVCNAPCPVTPGSSFPNVRDGKYVAWSLLRAVTDAAGQANLTNLVKAIEINVDSTVPDFVPYQASENSMGQIEPGLKLYRSHYVETQLPTNETPQTPENGINIATSGCSAEQGSDVGGEIYKIPASGCGNLDKRQ